MWEQRGGEGEGDQAGLGAGGTLRGVEKTEDHCMQPECNVKAQRGKVHSKRVAGKPATLGSRQHFCVVCNQVNIPVKPRTFVVSV